VLLGHLAGTGRGPRLPVSELCISHPRSTLGRDLGNAKWGGGLHTGAIARIA
jgi:hypothetical protein